MLLSRISRPHRTQEYKIVWSVRLHGLDMLAFIFVGIVIDDIGMRLAQFRPVYEVGATTGTAFCAFCRTHTGTPNGDVSTPLQFAEMSLLDHVHLIVELVDAAIHLMSSLIQGQFHGAAVGRYPYRALFITARTKEGFV